MIEYRAFYKRFRDVIKDSATADSLKVNTDQLARTTLGGIRKIQTLFPEARMDIRGNRADLASAAVNESTAATLADESYPAIPIPDEFEPMLEAYVMAWYFARDAQDAKDENLARHWNNRFADLAGVPRL